MGPWRRRTKPSASNKAAAVGWLEIHEAAGVVRDQKEVRTMILRSARVITFVPVCLSLLACSENAPEPEPTTSTRSALVTVVENRSLAVTDVAVLSAFSFEEILNQLITQA